MADELIKANVQTSSNRSSYSAERDILVGASSVSYEGVGTGSDTTGIIESSYSTTSTTKTGKETVKEYKKTEENILTGDASVLPDPNYRAKNTMQLKGLEALNGLYYVEKVTHTFNASGYSQVISFSKNGVGASIKSGVVINNSDTTTVVPVTVVNPPQPTQTTHQVTSNDTLWGLARTYYGDGSRYMEIFNANTNVLSNPDLIYDGQILIIP